MTVASVLFVLMGVAAILSAILTRQADSTVPVVTVSPSPLPLLVAQATNIDLIDFSTGPTFIKYEKTNISTPSTFQTTPDTFTIPKAGNYRISANVVVTETAGTPTTVLFYAQVNGSNNYLLGLQDVRDNGSVTLNGDMIVSLKTGDVVKMAVSQYFGSTTIGYAGIAATPTETFYLTTISMQYITE